MSVSEEAKKDIESVSNQPSEEWMDQNQAVKIAQSEFKKDEKESVTNFETPNVEQINFTEKPNVYKYDKTENMVGKQVYKITFHTSQDEPIGLIVFYLDSVDGKIYEEDYRE